jgi:hypothetical protein
MFALVESSMARFVADAIDGLMTIATTADDTAAPTQQRETALDTQHIESMFERE